MSILNCAPFCEGVVTWCKGNQKSTIDYMLCSKNILNNVIPFIVDEDRKLGPGSDHNTLLLQLDRNLSISYNRCSVDNVWNTQCIQNCNEYQELRKGICRLGCDKFNDINNLWESWKCIVISAAKDGTCIGIKKVNKKH